MEKIFKLKEHGTSVSQELLAGITTFLTMSYILAVNPGILGSIGGGMNAGAVFTSTVIGSAIAIFIMAFSANLPIALAPGMGLNAFFTYVVVGEMGYSWQIALTAVFLEGILFFILTLLNVRKTVINAIPVSLRKAVAVGIGLFIALIGFVNAGIVVGDTGTVFGLGNLTSGSPLLALLGLIIIIILYALNVPGSILIGILITAVIGIPLGVTKIPENWTPLAKPAMPLLFKFDFSAILSFKFFVVLFSFLFMDIFDSVGTVVGISTQAGLVDKNGDVPRVRQALIADSLGAAIGAALGTSTVTCYVESSAGVAAGGRTGLTAFVTGILFLLALFLSPIFLLIPSAATAPALVMVGFLMLKPVKSIDFDDPTEGIPAFLTIVMMPFAYSIAEGIVYGVLSYVVLKGATGKIKEIPIVTWILFVIFLLRFVIK